MSYMLLLFSFSKERACEQSEDEVIFISETSSRVTKANPANNQARTSQSFAKRKRSASLASPESESEPAIRHVNESDSEDSLDEFKNKQTGLIDLKFINFTKLLERSGYIKPQQMSWKKPKTERKIPPNISDLFLKMRQDDEEVLQVSTQSQVPNNKGHCNGGVNLAGAELSFSAQSAELGSIFGDATVNHFVHIPPRQKQETSTTREKGEQLKQASRSILKNSINIKGSFYIFSL
jgi:hypothetical protein